MADYLGTSGDDVLWAPDPVSAVFGLGGNDSLYVHSVDADDILADGGDGADLLSVTAHAATAVFDPLTGRFIYTLAGTVSLFGGAGADTIEADLAVAGAVIDAGADDDTIRLAALPGTALTVTTGTGSDTIRLVSWDTERDSATIVTDFTAGTGGDILDLTTLLLGLIDQGWSGDGNPFDGAPLAFEQLGPDTRLTVDLGGGPVAVVTLAGVDATALTAANLRPPYPPDGSALPALTLTGTFEDDTLRGGLGADTLTGLEGDDILIGSGGADLIDGGSGADNLVGGDGGDTLLGGTGDDALDGGTGTNHLDGGDGNDTLSGLGDGSYIGALGDDAIDVATWAAETLLVDGGDGADTIFVTAYNATISYSVPDFGFVETLAGTATVLGGDGADLITADFRVANAVIDAGADDDEIRIATAAGTALAITTGTGTDTIRLTEIDDAGDSATAVSDFTPGTGGDVLDITAALVKALARGTWDGSANPFATGVIVIEQRGMDAALLADFGDGPIVLLTLVGVAVPALTADNLAPPYAPDGSTTPGVALTGTDAGEVLDGGVGADVLSGMIGDDTLDGSAGDDLLDGGDGADRLFGGLGDDILLGGTGDDLLDGGPGADTLDGGAGNDTLIGSDGGSLTGGLGDDAIWFVSDAPATVVIDGGDGADTITATSRALVAAPLASAMVAGGDGDDTIALDLPGSDTLVDAGAGNDIVTITLRDGARTRVTLGAGADVIRPEIGALDGDAGLVVTDFDPDADGDVLDLSRIVGQILAGAAALPGIVLGDPLAGAIRLVQAEADTLVRIDTSAGPVVLLTLEGVTAAAIPPAALGPASLVVNHAPTGALLVTGTPALGETLSADTSALSDADGLGPFSYLWAADGTPIAGATSASLALGLDLVGRRITVAVSYTDGLGRAEQVTSAPSGPVQSGDIAGDSGDNILTGTPLADRLFGGDGDDTLIGAAGADILDGGPGGDTIAYAGSPTGVTLNMPRRKGLGGDAEGDIFRDVEHVTGSDFDDLLSGNDVDNTLLGGAGNDYLRGRLGTDTLIGGPGKDQLRGEEGADLLDGGDDNDIVFYIRSPSGVTIDLAAGTASGGHAEGDTLLGIENLQGSYFGDTLIGDAANNRLFGSGGSDVIFGGDGFDKITGGTGFDILTGGADIDRFIFDELNWGLDHITDFEDGVDTINITGLGLGFEDLTIGINGGNAKIKYDPGDGSTNVIILDGIDSTLIDAFDFIF